MHYDIVLKDLRHVPFEEFMWTGILRLGQLRKMWNMNSCFTTCQHECQSFILGITRIPISTAHLLKGFCQDASQLGVATNLLKKLYSCGHSQVHHTNQPALNLPIDFICTTLHQEDSQCNQGPLTPQSFSLLPSNVRRKFKSL